MVVTKEDDEYYLQDGKHRYYALLKLQNSEKEAVRNKWRDYKVPCAVVEGGDDAYNMHISASCF